VIDLDIAKFFDSVPWDLVVRAVQANTTHEQRWIVLYVRRWLAAPIVMPDGRTAERDRGTPQGGLCSAEHKDPNAQCWLMRSAGFPGLVVAGSAGERCA
jgi:retron-type reverse transcriptase